MKRAALAAGTCFVVLAGLPGLAAGQTWGLTELSKESKACIDCHKKENPAVYQQWGSSQHFRANIGCYECHAAREGEVDAYKHYEQWIATIVSPKDCARQAPSNPALRGH